MSFKPTAEQQRIIDAAPTTRIMKVSAAAGAAKTTTLVMVAQSTEDRGLYLAFNKAMAEEASEKFPVNTTCRTTHSIAFRAEGKKIVHKLNRPKGGYVNVAGTASEIIKFYDIRAGENINPVRFAVAVKQTVNNFESSADSEVDLKHVPYNHVKGIADLAYEKWDAEIDTGKLSKEILGYAKQLWEDRSNPNSKVLAGHDTYLKLYQLTKPKLGYDVIYLDEAQDTNDCVLDIILNQDCRKIIVGDSRQAIYQWRGAVNAMKKIEAPDFFLSKSFRYGQEIADVGMAVLRNDMKIEGFEKVDSKIDVVNPDEHYAVLYRSNSRLLSSAVNMIEQGIEINIETDVRGFCKKLKAANSLFNKDSKPVKHEEISIFDSWDELAMEAKEDPELKRLQKLCEERKAAHVCSVLEDHKNSPQASVTLTTGHKSKGREFEQVVLSDDFPSVYNDEGEYTGLSEPEENLLYVACTRAQNVLQINTTVEDILRKQKELQSEEESTTV